MEPAFKFRNSKSICTNCPHCGYLHFFNYKKIKAYGWKYQCRGCDEINDISEYDGGLIDE